jgi:hypothetical protein
MLWEIPHISFRDFSHYFIQLYMWRYQVIHWLMYGH